ncbi:50S ribosomal protein L10 [bacterium]|nr:50S ribosomal protein L10 [bacterium]
MARPEKIAEVEAITERMQAAQCMILADYAGCTVEQMTRFRETCRSKAVDCRVVKNRLARIAADNCDLGVMKDHLKGPTAILFGLESQIDAAKIVAEFVKDNEKMQIKGGMLDGQYLTEAEVVALSKTPSKEELIAKMMGSINSPASGLVGTMNGVAAALARAIDAVAKQKGEAA